MPGDDAGAGSQDQEKDNSISQVQPNGSTWIASDFDEVRDSLKEYVVLERYNVVDGSPAAMLSILHTERRETMEVFFPDGTVDCEYRTR